MPNAATIQAAKTTPPPAIVKQKQAPVPTPKAAPQNASYKAEKSCATCEAKNANGKNCQRWSCAYGPYCWQHTQSKLHLKVVDSKVKGAGKGLVAYDPKHKGEKDHVVFSTKKKNLPDHPTEGLITKYQVSDRYLSRSELQSANTATAPYALSIKGDKQADSTYYANPHKTNDGLGRYPNDPGWDGKVYNSTAKAMKEKGTVIKAQLYASDKKNKVTLPRTKNSNPKILDNKHKPLKTVVQPWVIVSPNHQEGIKQGEEIFVKYDRSGAYFKGKDDSSSSEEVTKVSKSRRQLGKKRK
jgi:hypothetical protein